MGKILSVLMFSAENTYHLTHLRSWNIGMCLHEDKLSLFNGVYRLSLCLLNSNSYDKSSIQVNLDWCTEPTGIKCNLQLRKGEQQTNEKIQGYYVNEHRMMRHLWSRSGKKKEGGGGLWWRLELCLVVKELMCTCSEKPI